VLGACLLGLLPLARTASRTETASPPGRSLPAPAAALGRDLAAVAASRGRSSDGCDGASGLVCSVVDVPLDRTGVVPGTVPLHVEMLPSQGTSRGAVFLLAGGPGQGSAQTFGLGNSTNAAFLRFLFPEYTLVAYDDRGTGRSGPLDCSALALATDSADPTQVAADCAQELGPQVAFYRTADHAADLDAVRAALGFDRITVLGVSYGTRQALAYASAFPAHVERLVLDSVEPPEDDRAFATNVLQAMPATLSHFCVGGRCARAAPAPTKTLSAPDFLGLVLAADLDPGLAAELPAAVHAARAGDPRPLLHVFGIAEAGSASMFADVSGALNLATICDDGPFPWQSSASLQDRQASLEGALAELPPGSFGPFGPWAARLGSAWACAGWPSSESDPPPGGVEGTLPDVPVLAFSGDLDLRTPTAGAAQVVARFPRGQLVVVPGVGHSVLTSDSSLCSQLDLRTWIETGRLLHLSCPRATAFIAPLAAFPSVSRTPLGAGATRTVAARTVAEAEAAWLASSGESGAKTSVRGIYGGTMVAMSRSFTLARYSIAPGVALSGTIRVRGVMPPLAFVGSVRVSAAASGTLTLDHGSLRGRLRAGRA
jgi:pimeloyl-ACP methyl ester carboxylesterase